MVIYKLLEFFPPFFELSEFQNFGIHTLLLFETPVQKKVDEGANITCSLGESLRNFWKYLPDAYSMASEEKKVLVDAKWPASYNATVKKTPQQRFGNQDVIKAAWPAGAEEAFQDHEKELAAEVCSLTFQESFQTLFVFFLLFILHPLPTLSLLLSNADCERHAV